MSFRGPGNTHSGGTDYYLCRTDDPGNTLSDCVDDYDYGFINHKTGNPRPAARKPSKSFNAGVVFAPVRNFDVSVDYFRVAMKNQVLDLDIESVLRDEADCLLGENISGTPVDITSPTCVDALSRVDRYVGGALDGEIQAVHVVPINIAEGNHRRPRLRRAIPRPDRKASAPSRASVGYTYVFGHTIQQYPGDPIVSKLAFDSDYYIPRDKGTASITWDMGKFSTTLTGQRLGKMPN